MGHIELSRDADLLVVAPATADLLAKMAHGLANDLASTALLATDKPVLTAPAMNVRMWHHAATQRNLEILRGDGISFVGPDDGEMACGEFGPGRMAEPEAIADAALSLARRPSGAAPLAGRRMLVTSGPTHEPIDPVRYIANRSSGKQGHAIAEALAALGADVTLVSRPGRHPRPAGRQDVCMSRPRATCWPLSRPHCRPTPPCSAPPWPTGASAGEGAEEDEKGQGRPASAFAGREPRHPRDGRASHRRTARSRGRLRGRDARRSSSTPRPSWPARDATGSSPTMSAPPPASWAATATPFISCRPRGVESWPTMSKDAVAARWRSGSPRA